MKYLAFLFLAIALGCSSPEFRQGEATQQFFKLDSKLQDVNLHHFADGGTYALELTDVSNNEVWMCLGSASFTQVIPKGKEDLPETGEFIEKSKHISIFMGVIHPSNDGAEKIKYRSEIETKILSRLQRFIESNPQFEEELSQFMTASQLERQFNIEYE